MRRSRKPPGAIELLVLALWSGCGKARFQVAGAFLGLAGPASAQTLYGITDTQLIAINTSTGAGTLVAPLGMPMLLPIGLAFRGTKLYTYTQTPDIIRELDPATGAILNTIDIGAVQNGEGDLAFRSDGIGFYSTAAPGSANLRRFDITVPNNTLIGPLSVMDGLAFNSAGVLYGLIDGGAALYTIDQTTAATTLVGNTGISGPFVSGGLAFRPNGQLFAAVGVGGGGPSFLYQVNPLTGAATLIGDIGFTGVMGIAFGPAVTVLESGGSTSVTEGGTTDSYTVVLDSAPSANVTVTVNPGPQLTVVPATLTFTPANWNTPQTVTVTAFDDALVEGPHTGTITHTAASADTGYNGITIASVTVNITDNETGPPPGDEGSFDGSGGPSGREGGFGGGIFLPGPVLWGPVVDTLSPTNLRVYNVSHRTRRQLLSASRELENAQDDLFAWICSLSVALGLGLLLIRMERSLHHECRLRG